MGDPPPPLPKFFSLDQVDNYTYEHSKTIPATLNIFPLTK